MDLSFTGFASEAGIIAEPGDLRSLIVVATARQASSPTAAAQARFVRVGLAIALPASPDGAFNGGMARALGRWEV